MSSKSPTEQTSPATLLTTSIPKSSSTPLIHRRTPSHQQLNTHNPTQISPAITATGAPNNPTAVLMHKPSNITNSNNNNNNGVHSMSLILHSKASSGISGTSVTRLSNPPTLVEHGNLRFLIMDAPSDAVLPLYLKELERYHVKHVVRVCDPTYSTAKLTAMHITVHDWPFDDGEAPPQHVIDQWLDLLESIFEKQETNCSPPPNKLDSNKDKIISEPTHAQEKPTIACHCVAGLGRAPVLVAIALIEQGMSALDSVAFIRERRRGAINNKQLKFLESYKRRRKRRLNKAQCCIQ